MDFNKFTIKSQEAVQQAQQLAMGYGHQSIEPGHLLKGILNVDENVTPFILRKLQVNVDIFKQTLDKILESYPKVEGAAQYLSNASNQALQKALAGNFDLILMDMMMPRMNGFEATRKIRKEGITIPIVALTAKAMKGDDKECLAAGCNGYLAKPIDRRELLKTLGKYLLSREPALIGTADSQES